MLEALLKEEFSNMGGELQVMDQNHHRANGAYNQFVDY
jgi:hypothetical protein